MCVRCGNKLKVTYLRVLSLQKAFEYNLDEEKLGDF